MDSTNKAGNCRLAEYLDGVRGKLFPRNDCDPSAGATYLVSDVRNWLIKTNAKKNGDE